MINLKNQKLDKYKNFLFQLTIFITYFFHNLFYTFKVGNHWDTINHIFTGGRFVEKIKLTLTDQNNPLLSDFIGQEFYGSIYQGPLHIITTIFYQQKLGYSFLIDTGLVMNETDYIFTVRHIFNQLYVLIIFIFIFIILKQSFSLKNVYLFTLGLMFFPSFTGHTLFNTLDIPFALHIFLASIYFLTKVSIKGQLNKFSKIEKLLVSFLFAFVLGIRANGFVFLAPLLIFYIYINQKNETLKSLFVESFKILLITISLTYLFTPGAWISPINYVNGIYEWQFQNDWNGTTLTNGEFIPGKNPKANYLITWFFYKTPVIYLLFFLLSFFKKFSTKNYIEKYSIFFIVYVFSLHALFNPISYDEIRHYLFLIPFFVVNFLVGFNFLIGISSKLQNPILLISLIYLFMTQFQLDHYKYTYLNELTSTQDISKYCSENINGCGNWITDYYGISGKEFVGLLDNHDISNLYVCGPSKSVTPYLTKTKNFKHHDLFEIKNNIPVQNETFGYDQFEIIYSEGPFRNFLNSNVKNEFYTFSIHFPQEKNDTCLFYLYPELKFDCKLEDSINRQFRGDKIYFSYLSSCTVTNF